MLCYQDRTFCISPECTNECGRKLTDEIRAEANEWWTKQMGGTEGGALFSVQEFCSQAKKKETTLFGHCTNILRCRCFPICNDGNQYE